MRDKITFFAFLVLVIVWSPNSWPNHTYLFKQTIFNNVPWFMYLAETGPLFNAVYFESFFPPNAVQFKESFVIISDKAFNLENVSYVVANSINYSLALNVLSQPIIPPFHQGCKIVSLTVDNYHQVVETVAPVIPSGESSMIQCTCNATEGEKPEATLIMNYSPGGGSTNHYTCRSGFVS